MPVIRPSGRAPTQADFRETLVDLLLRELRGDRSRSSPYIFEMPTGQDGQIDVVVIWEAWTPVQTGDRTAIIREAYQRSDEALSGAIHFINPSRASAGPLVPPVAITVGATYGEALAQGLLPYSIHASAMPDEADAYGVARLKKEVGGIETPDGIELRYPDPRLAAEALERLSREMPEARWTIADESGRFED